MAVALREIAQIKTNLTNNLSDLTLLRASSIGHSHIETKKPRSITMYKTISISPTCNITSIKLDNEIAIP